jgi:DNA-binding response OmpR family regulator
MRLTAMRLVMLWLAIGTAPVVLIVERLAHRRSRDGAEALASARERKPDLAVLDIAMPEVDGLEVLRRRDDATTSDLPVVLLSARAQEADVERGFAIGATAYLKKPFSPRELSEHVAELLR